MSKWPTYSAPYSDTCMMLKTKRCPQNIVQLKVENLKLGNALLQQQKKPHYVNSSFPLFPSILKQLYGKNILKVSTGRNTETIKACKRKL